MSLHPSDARRGRPRPAGRARRRGGVAGIARGVALALLTVSPAGAADSPWDGYLDYAYVYSSEEPAALRARLEGYGREAGASLNEHVARRFTPEAEADEARWRREAVAQLLLYLAHGEPRALEGAVRAVRELEDRLGRHENRYWYHYIHAHRALEKGHRFDFVTEVLKLWLRVVVPLETPYETLHTLSLSDSPSSGFVAALPYLYENTARLVLIRSQQMGMDRDLDPLAAVVRLLADGRVGGHPDVIPPEASSRDYLRRIAERLDGPESDAGSLTFTLALFEASKHHDRARGLLASEGLSPTTLEAVRVAAGAYETALNRADTVQGQAAVYARVLRQLGELQAARRRLGVDPEIELPFTIEGAIQVYGSLFEARGGGWEELGYRHVGREAYVEALHGLWQEIQEASLNAADTYLARALESPHRADEHAASAARIFARYLAFFHEYATPEGVEAVPDSAYFAAYEAAKGYGDAILAYAARPEPAEIELATRRYRSAIALFPFDRQLWSDLTAALARHGRESEYLPLVRPIAEWVVRSRAIDTWIAHGEAGAEEIAVLRRALSDSLVLMHMGFAEASGIETLEAGLGELRDRRDAAEGELQTLEARRAALSGAPLAAAPDPAALDAGAEAPGEGAAPTPAGPADYAALDREIRQAGELLTRLERQLAARSRALPLYRAVFETRDFADELRARRDHPLHALLRRMYHEVRG